jgi:hypothetical protein
MSEFKTDHRAEPGIPWASWNAWQAANQALDHHRLRYPADLRQLKSLAQRIESRLNSVSTILDDLCADSCPWCPEPCCLSASVWFDFKDLLFLHFNQNPIPPRQPKWDKKSPCRYLGSRGCRLPRIARPWICTWYLCPTQTAKLRRDYPARRDLLNQAFARIKADRNMLESEYINVVI